MPLNNGEQAGDDNGDTMDFSIHTSRLIKTVACLLVIALGMAAVVMCWIVALEMHADMINRNLIYRHESGTWLIRRVIRKPKYL